MKATVFLANADVTRFNEVYAARLGRTKPARSTVIARLIQPELIAIEVVAER